MDISTRPATLADLKALIALNGVVQDLHLLHEPRYFRSPAPEEVESWFASFFAKPRTMIWIAESSGTAVGYLAAQIQERDASPFCPSRRWCEVDQLGVSPTHRKQGVARLLLAAVRAAALSQGVGELQLSTWHFNDGAREAFHRLGFRPSLTRWVHRLDADIELLSLEEPAMEYRDSYRSLVEEFLERGEPLVPFPLGFPNDDFVAFLAELAACSRGEGLASAWVPHSTYWLVLEGREVVGVSNLRHRLTDKLRREGGHIGYGVRPSARGKGFSRELLHLTLLRARAMGIEDVLLTCARANKRSIATILANGGALDSEEILPDEGKVIQRYWIRGTSC